MALTQEIILTFLLEHGGKVKNSELLNNFKCQINCSDPAEKKHNRDLFKKIVNSVAVVKQCDEVKFVFLKKRYQDFIKAGVSLTAQKSDADDSFISFNTSFSTTCSERSAAVNCEYGKLINSHCRNNSMTQHFLKDENILNDNVEHIRPHSKSSDICSKSSIMSNTVSTDTSIVKVLNLSSDQTNIIGKSTAVFAVIAVKPDRQDSLNSEDDKMFDKNASSKPPMHLHSSGEVNSEQELYTPNWSKNVDKERTQIPPSPPKIHSKNLKDDDSKYSESVPLEPRAHEWLVKSAAGMWGQVYALLLQDTQLAGKKDFMSGFTAIHWAAKDGNEEMVRKIMHISKRRGKCVDINTKTHCGYTPLHIAAVHGHDKVMTLLVQGYGANTNIRDNDGKKPYHYLSKHVSHDIRELLGVPQESHYMYREKRDDDDYRDLPKGFNTLSRLFHPGHRKKQESTTSRHSHK